MHGYDWWKEVGPGRLFGGGPEVHHVQRVVIVDEPGDKLIHGHGIQRVRPDSVFSIHDPEEGVFKAIPAQAGTNTI
jgi:hypothetical protein